MSKDMFLLWTLIKPIEAPGPDTTTVMPLITYLAEDNETIAKNLIETLQEICPVRVTGLGTTQAEATEWLHVNDGQWDLAIVDLFLKEGSGLGVLAGCRDRKPHQKVVVLTNYATPEIRIRAMELCADAVFDKSSELDQLFAYCTEQTEPTGPAPLTRNLPLPSAEDGSGWAH